MGWLFEIAFDAIFGTVAYEWYKRQPKWLRACVDIAGLTLLVGSIVYLAWTLID